MPVTKQFLFSSHKFKRRTRTTIQHKLRVVLNCYTVSEFQLNENDNTFSCKKNYKINGMRIEGKNTLTGNYSVEGLDENEQCKITITVNT